MYCPNAIIASECHTGSGGDHILFLIFLCIGSSYLQYTSSCLLLLTAWWVMVFWELQLYTPWAPGWISSIVKFSLDPEVETSESLLDVAPLKAQVSCWDGSEGPEQLKRTVEPRLVKSVPLCRTEAGLMNVFTFSGWAERWNEQPIFSLVRLNLNLIWLSFKHKNALLLVLHD